MPADPVWFAAWRPGVHRAFRSMVELSDMDVAMVALVGLVELVGLVAAATGGASRLDPGRQRR
jgi:hypothetical protein